VSNVRFLYTHKFDMATIYSSSEVAGLPDDNAVQEFVAKKWRTTGKGTVEIPEWIKFYVGSTAKKITMLAIFGHNLTSGAIVKLQAYSSDEWTVPPAYESAALTWNAQALVLFLDQTYTWWRITIADPNNTDGYIEIGRICAGEYYEPGMNIIETVTMSLIDPSIVTESDGGQGYSIEKTKYRMYSVQFGDINTAQQEEIETMFRAVGTTKPLIFALDPGAYPEAQTIYGKFKGGSLDRALKTLAYGDCGLVIEEKVT